jgi:hypothetical protein
MWWCELDWFGLGYGPVECSCDHCNEPLNSLQCWDNNNRFSVYPVMILQLCWRGVSMSNVTRTCWKKRSWLILKFSLNICLKLKPETGSGSARTAVILRVRSSQQFLIGTSVSKNPASVLKTEAAASSETLICIKLHGVKSWKTISLMFGLMTISLHDSGMLINCEHFELLLFQSVTVFFSSSFQLWTPWACKT